MKRAIRQVPEDQEFEELEEVKERIRREKWWVGKKLYSHNIISICLREIAENYGQAEANKAIRELRLKRLGWHEEEV